MLCSVCKARRSPLRDKTRTYLIYNEHVHRDERETIRRETIRRATIRRETIRRETIRRETIRRATIRRETIRRERQYGERQYGERQYGERLHTTILVMQTPSCLGNDEHTYSRYTYCTVHIPYALHRSLSKQPQLWSGLSHRHDR